MALPGSVLIITEVPELAFFEPCLYYQLGEDKATGQVASFSWIQYNYGNDLKSMKRYYAITIIHTLRMEENKNVRILTFISIS